MVHVLEKKLEPAVLDKIQDFVYFGEKSQDFTFLGAGKNADVFQLNGTEIAVKKFYEDAWDNNDHIPLNRLRGIEYYPTLYAYEPSKFMAMECVQGKTLYEIENTSNHLYKEYRKELIKAAEQAQSRGLYTNDVHLNNIMLGYDGSLKIVDVGRFTFAPTTDNQLLKAMYSSPANPWTGTRYMPGQGTWRPNGASSS